MTIELVKILEAALEDAEMSNYWFAKYEQTNDNEYWEICKQYDEHAKGLLQAYQIMTGRHVICGYTFIREELLAVA